VVWSKERKKKEAFGVHSSVPPRPLRLLDVAMSYMNIGIVYNSQGQYERALETHHKSVDIQIRVVDHDHPGRCHLVL
jgi:hypothetical protein